MLEKLSYVGHIKERSVAEKKLLIVLPRPFGRLGKLAICTQMPESAI